METGQKTIQKSNNKIDHIGLSIQVSLNGFSFCILNKNAKSVDFYEKVVFEKKQTPTELQSQLTKAFNSTIELQQDFGQVVVVHDNELSTLVPKELFNKDHLADYLKFNTRILQTDFIAFDELQEIDAVNVYVPYANINNYIFEHFGEFSYHHTTSLLVDGLKKLDQSTEPIVYAHFESSHFELVVLNNKDLLLYNRFDYQTDEDVLYYILFTAEQLHLNPETFSLALLGQIDKNNSLYKSLYTYIRHVELIDLTNTELDVLAAQAENNFVQLHSL